MSQLSKEPWPHPLLGYIVWGHAEGAIESGVMFRDPRKDQACWGVMNKESGSMSLRAGWATQFSVHREPVREVKGEVSFAQLFSLL